MSKCLLLPLFCVVAASQLSSAQTNRSTRTNPQALNVIVLDENGVAVASARVSVESGGETRRCETDVAGRCEFYSVNAPSQLQVQKEGFYVFALPEVQTLGTVEARLTHEQEVRETVNVTESLPEIDPAQITAEEKLSGLDILNIPYPNTRDYRYALSFLPNVVLDQTAQPHLAGGETYQTQVLVDDFDLTQPANGQLLVRVSTDALRSVTAETSRIPARYGKKPAGILAINTGIGDDHYRFAATNFIPSVQDKKGVALDKVDPRFTFSGPIQKGKIWFFDGLDGEYDNVIVPGLPTGEDNNHIWRLGNLAKLQANVTPEDIVTTSFLINRLHDDHHNISPNAPATTTPEDSESLYFISAKDQHALSAEKLLEVGVAFAQYGMKQTPIGSQAYIVTPTTAEGNYFLTTRNTATRWQALANFYAAANWHGRHNFIMGADEDRLSYFQLSSRAPITFYRCSPRPNGLCQDGTAAQARKSTFSGSVPATTYNTESSVYIQDSWSLFPRLLIEPGVRFDWDEIVRRPVFAPRLAGTFVLNESGNTKLSAGVGTVYESTNLLLVSQPLAGMRTDRFFDQFGNQTATSVASFSSDPTHLLAPRYINWSFAAEQKLPHNLFVKAEFIHRNGIHGFVYDAVSGTNFVLQNTRQDHYHALTFDLRYPFRKRYIITASYSRSSSRSNQVLDYSIDNPILSPQVSGPYPWDAPNRFISWGLLPLIKNFDAAYSVDFHTGFPFPTVNSQQQLVNPPGVYRFLDYFTLNFHLEKRFDALGFHWALRGGFDNLTNHQNAYVVNNVVGSPTFLTFSGFDRRAFTARIRFLGRK